MIYDVIILGAGCSGLTAGIYAGRAKLRTLIIERQQVGGQAATTDEIANYPGFESISGPALMEKLHHQATSFGAELIYAEVTKVDFSQDIKTVETSGKVYSAYTIIVATGANPKQLGFEGEQEFRGRGVGYCATCDGFFFDGKDIFVIGGGFSAAEEALYLTRFGKKVTIVVRKDKFRCAQSIIDQVMKHPKIEVKFHTELVRAYGEQLLEGAVFKNNETGETWEYHVSKEDQTFGIFVFIGYKPTTDLFVGQIDMDENGYILTSEVLETNVAGVFAAGDLRPKMLRQLVTATSDGAIAAVSAEKYLVEYKEAHGIKDEAQYESKEEIAGKSKEHEHHTAASTPSSFLTPEIQQQVKTVFEKLTKKLSMVTILDDSNEKTKELYEFVKEVASLSDKIELLALAKDEDIEMEKKIKLERLPVLALLNENKEYSGVKFLGIPSGHEFNSLIFAIYNLAGNGQALEEATLKRITEIKTPKKIQVAISLSCHFCPEAVIAAQRIAMLNPNVEAEMLDIGLFPELKQKYNIMSVPAIIVNQDQIVFGAQKIEGILEILERDNK